MQCVCGAGLGLATRAFPLKALPHLPTLQKTNIHHDLHGQIQFTSAALKSQESAIKKEKQRVTRLYSLAVPLFALAAGQEVIQEFSNWKPSQATIKTIYMVFAILFSWGCCVFGSMNDPFYESEEYRNSGGDGTQNWIYYVEEMEEEKAREELWREELIRELDEKVGELRDAEESQQEKEKEKEKELV